MKVLATTLAILAIAVMWPGAVIANCGSCAGDHGAAEEEGHSHADSADVEARAELGCGKCTYNKEGVTGCKAAVKIDDQVYLLKGGDVDAHKHGLCKAPKQAMLTGKVENDLFVASKVQIDE